MNKRVLFKLILARSSKEKIWWLSLFGVAAGIIVLTVTLSIIDGFSDAYRDGLIRFNAPLVIMREDEKVDRAVVEAELEKFALIESVETSQSEVLLANRIRDFWTWGNWQYNRLWWGVRDYPIINNIVDWLSPRRIVRDGVIYPWISNIYSEWKNNVRNKMYHGITARSPFLYREGLLIGEKGIFGVVLRGVEPSSMLKVNTMKINSFNENENLETSLHGASEKVFPILLGGALSKKLGKENLKLYLPVEKNGVTEGRYIPVEVVGTFESGIYEYDAQFLFVDLERLQNIYNATNVITGYELQIDQVDKAPWIADALRSALGPDYDIRDWRELHRETFQAMAMQKILLGLMMGILVLISSANIVTSMLLRMLSRHRSIATLKALGMPMLQTKRMLFWQGIVAGGGAVTVGVLVGVILSKLLGYYNWINISPEIYFLSSVPTSISPLTLTFVFALGFICVCGSASIAARKVSKLPILRALGRNG